MAKHGLWTVIFEDKMVIKKCEDFSPTNPCGHEIDDDAFWNDAKWNNYHAIQFTDDNTDNDQVEFSDDTSNGEYDQATVGDFRTNFINRFDAAHLAHLQAEWDDNNEGTTTTNEETGEATYTPETEAEKIARLGARPTSYTSA
jgi:hypothetical protein|tara:strand:- start:10839 stop:11267 length:429 start_codon:yes stop_codon:yes gene_type:complete